MSVTLHVANRNAFVWSPADGRTLRTRHAICGSLCGTLPQVAQQNIFLGLPLVLLPEEVKVLLLHDLAILVNDAAAHTPATPAERVTYLTHRRRIQEQQCQAQALQEAKKRAEVEIQLGEGMRARRAARRAERPLDDSNMFGSNSDDMTMTPTARTMHTVWIAGQSQAAWYRPGASTRFPSMADAERAGIWQPAPAAHEAARARIFEDLWRRGHYMGSGLRFGGDFLVYPGDTLRYHSHFTATVLPSVEARLPPLAIVAEGRLATAVKKAHLLCSMDELTGQPVYLTIEWAVM